MGFQAKLQCVKKGEVGEDPTTRTKDTRIKVIYTAEMKHAKSHLNIKLKWFNKGAAKIVPRYAVRIAVMHHHWG